MYITNRLSGNATDNVVRFELSLQNGTASVTFKQYVDSLGISPRSIAVDKQTATLYVTNTEGDVGLCGLPTGSQDRGAGCYSNRKGASNYVRRGYYRRI